jgi:succinylglutamic semialdehyde dehydrogenase
MISGRGQFIGGCWIPKVHAVFQSIDPSNGNVVWEGPAAPEPAIDHAVSAAREAFEKWGSRPVGERAGFLRKFAENLRQRRDELSELISLETGKTKWDADGEVASMVGKIDISIAAYEERCRQSSIEIGGARGITRFRPHGVTAVIGPFNFPGHLPNGHIVPALLAGNTVVFKPSEYAPGVAQRTVEIWEESDLPAGVMNLLQGGRLVSAALAEHPGIDGIYFTGSYAGGSALHRSLAGSPGKILALEMGGNNPLIVSDVANLTAAALITVQSAYISAGQRCSCARRLIVPVGSAGDQFVARLVEMVAKIRVGRFTDRPEPFLGPVISDRAAEHLLDAQKTLRDRGGVSLVEMRSVGSARAMLSPGLMDVSAVKNREDVEYFGPFLQLIRVADFDEAIAEANSTEYGLAAGLLSDRADRYEQFYRQIRAGVVNWNRPTTGASSKLPFGGVGHSGNHRPGAYLAADYCAYPVASIEAETVALPEPGLPGMGM